MDNRKSEQKEPPPSPFDERLLALLPSDTLENIEAGIPRDPPPLRKKKCELTQTGFGALLARLDPDSETAGKKLTEHRQRLNFFFERNGCRTPEELIDETICRVCQKLDEGTEIRDPFGYSYGVARNVWHEYLDAPGREWEELDDNTLPDTQGFTTASKTEEQKQQRLDCMRGCLEKLPVDQRNQVVLYEAFPDQRKQTAEQFGITLEHLRVRIGRIKNQLNTCQDRCLKKA